MTPDLATTRASGPLVGRGHELEALDGFLREAGREGATLLLAGEPGVGKTALLEAAGARAEAAGFRVLRSSGVIAEAELSYAALHQLVAPVLEARLRLPAGHRAALEVAVAAGSGRTPERLAVMHATLELLSEVARTTPVLVLVDDLQHVDPPSASVIGFVGRRVRGHRLGVLGATRPGSGFFERAGLPVTEIRPLDDEQAMDLLARRFRVLPIRVRRRLVAEAQGNPLALLEFAAAAQSPGRVPRAGPGRDVRDLYAARLATLPDETRRVLLLAALEGTGSLGTLGRAGGPSSLEALGPAERDGLVAVDPRSGGVRFRHPLVKAAVLDRSTHAERCAAHQRLAETLADQPERRAHHLAEGTVERDEEVAEAIALGARHARRRGDLVGAITRLVSAAELTPDPGERSRRLGEAAYLGAYAAGELGTASRLLERLDDPAHPTRSLEAATATSYLLLNTDGTTSTAYQLMSDAVGSAVADATSPESVTDGLFTLLQLCHYAGRADHWLTFHRAMDALGPAAATDLRLLASALEHPSAMSADELRLLDERIAALREVTDADVVIRTALAACYVDRLPQCRPALVRVADEGREGGAFGAATFALLLLAWDETQSGRWEAARRSAGAGVALARVHGNRLLEWGGHWITALAGVGAGDDDCTETCRAMIEWAAPRELRRLQDWGHHALARAAAGVGRWDDAYRHAVAIGPVGDLRPHGPEALWSAFDLVEAAVHLGRRADAEAHVAAMREAGLERISGRFALTTKAAAGLVAVGDRAAELFAEALAASDPAWPFESGRAHLVFGEWLRRSGRNQAARRQLDAALECFVALGATPWVRRAEVERRATGATRSGRGVAGSPTRLTPQELEVARLAASGLSNAEIAARLFVSPRTVSSHLYRAFPKLGVRSRAGLRDALGS